MSLVETSGWDDVVERIGDELADQLSAALGGARLYIPKYAGPHHPLTEAVGEKAAAQIVAVMAGDYLSVPIAQGLRARIVQLREANEEINAIAVKVGRSRSFVFKVLAEYRADHPEQLDLFG